MDQSLAAERILAKLTGYGQARKQDVAKGLETAQLAGVLTQKYGYGLCDAFSEIYREGGVAPTYADVDRVVETIDPDWRETQSARWKAKAGLDLTVQRKNQER